MQTLPRFQRACLTLAGILLATGSIAARPASAQQSAPAAANVRLRLVPHGQAGVDLSKLSFQQVSALIRDLEEGEELVLPLPFAGMASFAGIEVAQCELALDEAGRALVVAGAGSVRGRASRVFLAGTFPASGPGRYAFGVRPDALALGQWFPALKATPLGGVQLLEAGLVVAEVPHTLPSSELVASILGAPAAGAKGYELQAGVGLRATLAAETLPAAARLLSALGIEKGRLSVSGRLGSDVDLLLGEGQTRPVDVELRAQLQATAMQGLRNRLPSWVRPTSAAPSLDLAYSSATGELAVGVGFDAAVEVAGESRPFRLSGQLDTEGDASALTLRGETAGAWQRPLGIDWLSLEGASLVVSGNGGGAQASLASSLKLGAQVARVDVVLDEARGARLEVRLDSVTVGDLASFVSQRTGSSFVGDLQLGDAAQLRDMVLTLARSGQRNALELTATAKLGGASADLLLTLTGSGKGKVEPLFALRRRDGRLSDLLPALRGKPADLEFPQAVWTLTPPKAAPSRLASADLGPTARAFFSGVYGGGDFVLELHPGIRFGAALPMAKLPPALVQALGVQDPKSSLVLEGTLAMSLDLAQGRPSAAVESLELSAELPRVSGAAARLPQGLPAWMRPESTSQSTLTVRYAAPSSVTFLKTNDVVAALDGQDRRFRIATEVSADAKQGKAAVSGALVGEWKQPFGLKALSLRDVRIAAEGQAAAGRGGAASGAVVLEGGFDLGAKRGRMQLELTGASGREVSGSFTGALDDLALDDLPRLELFPNLPKEGLNRLASTLGKLPPLQEPTLHVALGGGQPSVTLSGRLDVNGTRAHLLAFVGKGAKGPQAVIGLRPEGFSLARLFPKLGQNPAVAPMANVVLENFGLLAVLGELNLKSADVEPQVREFFTALTGQPDFDLKLSAGLNLEARFPADRLPAEMTQALQRLNQTMGIDQTDSLSLRGTLGASMAEMRLAAALPPLRPARAPQWLKSGELAFVLTGTPSFMLAATLVVDCDGDLLNLVVEGGVERQGANVAIALKGALQADDVWDSPFGMEWLEIRRFSGQVSIDAIANIGFGGGGDVTIGRKDIKVFAWTKINSATGVPMGLVVNGESKEGVALLDLAQLQADMRKAANAGGPKLLPLDQLPDIALRDFALLIASRAVPEEGITSAGFQLKGDLYLPLKPGAAGTKMLAVDCGVSKEGIYAKGYLGAYKVGPLTWEDASFDLEATLAAQHLLANGRVELLGSSSQTDLRFTREELSFATSREIQGLGKTQLLVSAKFDLKNPSFHAHGQLDNEFGKTFGESALGEVLDVGGKAAGVGKAALDAFTTARDGVDGLRKELGVPTALETVEAIALQRLQQAEAAAKEHKREMDAKYREWQETPTSQPARRKARELAWGQSRFAYEQGPMSRLKVLDRRKTEYENVRARVAALEAVKAENQRVQAILAAELGRINAYKGKTLVVTSASIDAKLEVLMALKDGMPVDMSLELLFCGEPKSLNIPWVVGKPAVNARMVAQHLVPGMSGLAGS